jgi:RimJ/RimL family protein N-acetyltransferase
VRPHRAVSTDAVTVPAEGHRAILPGGLRRGDDSPLAAPGKGVGEKAGGWCYPRVTNWTETPRLRLRPFTPDDAADLAALHGDPEVMRFIDDGQPVPREVIENSTLPGFLAEYRELPCGQGCFVAEEIATDRFLGWFSARPAVSAGLDGGIEVGYRIRPAVWGRGFATEGLRLLVARVFTDPGADRVVATTMTVNTRSRRVLEKAGLTLVRTFFLEWPEYIEGAEHGDVEYSLSREDWACDRARH